MSLRMRVALATATAVALVLVIVGVVIFATYSDQIGNGADDNLKTFLTVFILSGAGAVLLALGLGWLAGRVTSIRMTQLVHQLGAVGNGNTGQVMLPGGERTETVELSEALNASLERIRSTSANLESALAGQRHLLADAARSLRTPMMSVATSLHVLQRRPDLPEWERRATVDRSLDDISAMRRFVDGLDLLARLDSADSLTQAPFSWVPLLQAATDAGRMVCAPRSIIFGVSDRAREGYGDVDAINELLMVLFDNVAAHTPPSSQVTVGVSEASQGTGQELVVADDGPGVAPGLQERIFDPFMTSSGTTAGLGLAIARAIVRAHGGTITAETNDRHGLRVRVTLPAPRRTTPLLLPEHAGIPEASGSPAGGGFGAIRLPESLENDEGRAGGRPEGHGPLGI